MKEIKVKLTFTEPILGTSPANPDVYREFIGSKSPDALSVEDEVAALGADAVADKGMTVFPRLDDGTPFLYDYQIKGFFKDTCGGLRKVKGTASEKIKSYKKEIDMRGVLDGLFGDGLCEKIFGEMSLYASADGLPVWENFILAVIDLFDDSVKREAALSDKRIQKHVQKYHR